MIRQYGTVRPCSRIHAAERGRIHQLWRLFVAHGLPIPPNPWTGGVNSPASLADACGQALEQEQARLKRYGQLLVCTDQEELRQVFRAQAEASEQRHGPAYGRCGCPDGPRAHPQPRHGAVWPAPIRTGCGRNDRCALSGFSAWLVRSWG